MTRLLGIDLGTSSVKAVIIDEKARLLAVGSREYPIDVPQPGYAEQDPQAWWKASVQAIRQAVEQAGSAEIDAIGLSGQMHGTILMDDANKPIGPAIIWADQRSAAEVDEIVSLVGTDQLARIAGTAPATGFMGPTLRWIQKHNPARLDRTRACLLPKDYLRFRLTGDIATEATDACATALFDQRQRQWSSVIIEALDLPDGIWPNVYESSDIVGVLSKTAAEELGLPVGIPIAAGSGDQPAQACHAPADRWYVMGAMLGAGLSLRWLRDLHGLTADPEAYSRLSALADAVAPGSGGLLFLPYLVGERAPLMDPLARGGFIGLTLGHGLGDLTRAIMEGVGFALRQILDVMVAMNAPIDELLASGGGLASPVWRQIVADILARPLRLSTERERAGVGAAIVAGIGIGTYASYAEAPRPASSQVTEPDPRRAEIYSEQYALWLQAYPLLKELFHHLS